MKPVEPNTILAIRYPIIGFLTSDLSRGYLHRLEYHEDKWCAFVAKNGVNTGNYYGRLGTLKDVLKTINNWKFFQFEETVDLFAWLAADSKIKIEEKPKKSEYNQWLEKNFKVK